MNIQELICTWINYKNLKLAFIHSKAFLDHVLSYKILIFIGLYIFLFNICTLSQTKLSETSQISLLTCDQGQELYSIFGHSAIRIQDPILNIDWVFNYGTFDFNTPNFYLKFANGNLNYMLSVGEYHRFVQFYFREERSIREQILNLTFAEKQKLFAGLVNNAAPENKFYRYDFFFDNCATRIRDIVFNSVDGKVLLDSTLQKNMSFRQLYGEYLKQSPWIEFGIHLLLGVKADYKANAWNEMYLPDYLEQQFAHAVINHENGNRNLVSDTKQVLLFDNNNDGLNDTVITPAFVFWMLFILILILMIFIKSNHLFFRIFDKILFLAAGLTGLLLTFLWFFTLHKVTQDNYNILWASPFSIFLPVLIMNRFVYNKFSRSVLLVNTTGLILMLLFWLIIPQEFPEGLYPLVMIIFVRTGSNLIHSLNIKIINPIISTNIRKRLFFSIIS